jgi:ABC-type bacteriocin/lantibiotic exporter with double-glycine peptidase domain
MQAQLKTPSAITTLQSLWPALRGAWLEVGIASVFVNSGQLLLPLFSMLVYDKVVNNGVFETLWALTIGMLIYLATDIGMRLVRAWSTEHIAEKLTKSADTSLWQKIVAQTDISGGFAKFLSNYRDLTASRDFVSSTYLLAIADLPFLALYLLAVAIIAWPLLIVASLLVALYTALGYYFQHRSNKLAQASEKENTLKLSYMGEVLGSLDVVRTVPNADSFFSRWQTYSANAASIDGERRLASTHTNNLSAFMVTFSSIAILITGAYLIEARMLSVGGLIACNLLTARAMGLVSSLFMVLGKWQDFGRAAQRMDASLNPPQNRLLTPRAEIAGNINVINLSKEYPERPICLDSISLKVMPGERIALLGKPGAGKTTLLRCLAGLNSASSGQILFDGLDIKDIATSDKAKWLAWKSQEPNLFAGTLEQNLLVAGVQVSDERFAKALWASGLIDEINSGRMTLGMTLAENGSNLSGGQRQKVALARVFAQPCRILLLDEPTLGLDPEGERMLAERLPQILSPKDVLMMTTHSSVMLGVVQRVIALDAGKMVADGAREKLVKINH